MPKWKRDATEFVVSLNPTSGTHGCKIPKPIVDRLGNHASLRFAITKNNKVSVTAGTGVGRRLLVRQAPKEKAVRNT